MANPERGEVALAVGDQTYKLVLDMDAICMAEEAMSRPNELVTIGQIFIGAAHKSQRHVRVLVWAALQRHQPDISLRQAGQLLVDIGGTEKFFATLKKLRGITEPEGEARPRKARQSKAGARTTSTRGASASAGTTSGG